MVDDFGDGGEGDFDEFAVRALDFDGGARQRLRLLEAADDAADARARLGHDLDVVLAVERLERRQSLSYFHVSLLVVSKSTPRAACARGRGEPQCDGHSGSS